MKLDVPYVPTPHELVELMLDMAEVKSGELVYDLGCGDGRVLLAAARRGCRCIGVEKDPAMHRKAERNTIDSGLQVTLVEGDLFDTDLSMADVLLIYLLPSINNRLLPQINKMKPGSRVVSHNYDFKGYVPDKESTWQDDTVSKKDHRLFMWTCPLRKNSDA